LFFWVIGALSTAAILGALPIIGSWPLPIGLGGIVGDAILAFIASLPPVQGLPIKPFALLAFGIFALFGLAAGSGVSFARKSSFEDESEADDEWSEKDDSEEKPSLIDRFKNLFVPFIIIARVIANIFNRFRSTEGVGEPTKDRRSTRREPGFDYEPSSEVEQAEDEPVAEPRRPRAPAKASKPKKSSNQLELYTFPPVGLLTEAKKSVGPVMSSEALEENARQLESVLDDFGVKGDVGNVRPGPVVTLYELEPAPGIKSSRVVGLADDIARSMSAVSARVAVVPGRNAIGIELPNQKRETVYLRELINNKDFVESQMKLALALGKTIGGEPVIVDLARMPHLLVAGTTGSGKSVAINTMILSLLYRLKPEECRLIMVDPKMLELSVYDGIPHLLTPVVTDPRKAVVALKWAVREMEERYKKMSKLGVRNIDGFNARVSEAKAKGEQITRTVQTGFDRDTGEAIFENEVMELEPLPFIVVIVDEMADLMMVAGKDIEGAIQRLAQMARAAGIHVILATQRPSVDVITGTIKANFPTRISFQVTSKIDSRTILGEQGAEQLLGQGDMLFMAGGGRISRVHGPFVSDGEVEKVVAHLKSQGRPNYLEDVTREDQADVEEGGAVFDNGSFGSAGQDLYDQAVAIVLRDRKASTSYIQRRLQIGYNRAASIMERMEDEGVVGSPNHAGKREILMEAGGHGSHAA
jgi:S-DNA-T family DNA segregation ATPase FtsK/SpoIIIE